MSGEVQNPVRNLPDQGASISRSLVRPPLPMMSKTFKGPIFWFPYNVNETASRLVAAQVVALCILGIVARKEPWMWYITCGIFGDYCLRIIAGSRFSALGSLADWACAFLPVKLIPGAPKQFASLCGATLSGLAVICFYAPVGENSPTGAAVMLGLLMGAAFLESAFGFCLGCWMFAGMVRFGILPHDINKNSEDVWSEQERFIQDSDRRMNEGPGVLKTIYDPLDDDNARTIPFRYKHKTDKMKAEDFGIVKHMHIHYFAFPMSAAGLAGVWCLADPIMYTSTALWQGLAVFSAIVGCIYILLYILKLIKYPRKVVKEWVHPVKSNFFSCITITILLYSFLASKDYLKFAKALFWIGAPLQLFQAMVLTSRWISRSQSVDTFNPAWMFPAVGNLVAAIVGPRLAVSYIEAGWLWWSFAFLMYIVLLTLTLQHAIFRQPVDDKIRSSVFIWVAAPAVAFASYLTLTGSFDFFARFLFFVTLVTFWVTGWLFINSYFGRNQFDQGYWGYVFPLDTLAFATILYHNEIRSDVSLAMAVISLILVNAAAVIILGNTVASLLKRRMFVPEDKWGPISFTKVLHFSIRDALQKLRDLAIQIECKNSNLPAADEDVHAFRQVFQRIQRMFEIHSMHEDKVLFPALQAWYPHVTAKPDHEHVEEAEKFTTIAKLIGTGEEGRIAYEKDSTENKLLRCRAMGQLAPELCTAGIKHMNNEELNLSPVIRKHIPIKMQKEIMRQMFDITRPDDLKFMFGFVLQYAPFHGQRARFVHCIRWAFPERIQMYGKWMYETTDALKWSRLVTEVPDLTPRNVADWTPYY